MFQEPLIDVCIVHMYMSCKSKERFWTGTVEFPSFELSSVVTNLDNIQDWNLGHATRRIMRSPWNLDLAEVFAAASCTCCAWRSLCVQPQAKARYWWLLVWTLPRPVLFLSLPYHT